MKVVFTAEAEQELVDAATFYAAEASTALGLAFIAEVDRSRRLLEGQPMIGSVWRGTIRRLTLRRFPFSVVYLVGADVIQVIAIAHQRRKPGYWMP